MSFDVSRLRRADQIVGASAIALFIFLFFFKWYGGSASSSVGGLSVNNSFSGWHTFTNSRWIWLITIIVALGAVAIAAGTLKFESPVQLGVLVAGLGALSTALILYRILHHPSGGANSSYGAVHLSYSFGIKIGIWLGLIAAGGITYGGYLGMRAEGTTLADVGAQAREATSSLRATVAAGQAGGVADAPAGERSEPLTPPIPPPAAPPLPDPPPQSPPER